MDDNAAKKTAKYLGLSVTGTLGVIIKAKNVGLIDNVKDVINQLVLDGLFMDDRLINKVLELAGEL
jgi:predicted nucleic acid-binding protein